MLTTLLLKSHLHHNHLPLGNMKQERSPPWSVGVFEEQGELESTTGSYRNRLEYVAKKIWSVLYVNLFNKHD